MSARFPLVTQLTAHVLDVTACHADGSIEVLVRIGRSEVTVHLSRAEAIEADVLERDGR